MSESKDGWLADPEALVGKHEPANDLGGDLGSDEGPRARGPVRASPRSREGATTEVVSRKELARLLRRQAYQRAKLLRATDPRQIAMKEALKQRRRAAYQAVKAKRKAAAAEQKSAAKAERAKERSVTRRATSDSLMQHVKRGVDTDGLPPRRRPPSE